MTVLLSNNYEDDKNQVCKVPTVKRDWKRLVTTNFVESLNHGDFLPSREFSNQWTNVHDEKISKMSSS